MADEEEAEEREEGDEDLEGEEDEGSAKKSGKKKLLIVIAVVLLLAVGGIAAAYFTGLLQPVLEMVLGQHAPDPSQQAMKAPQKAIFFPLEELIVNLNTGGRKSTFLKIRVSLELVNQDDIARIQSVMPRVMDSFQVYLRELRIEDLKGSAGMYRIREELLARVNAAAAPAKVRDVLFKEMIVQ
jgi:flagellar protein FliL